MNIVKMLSGSIVYGTNSPSSDRDVKGIFLPTLQDCALLRAPKNITHHTNQGEGKNTKDDVDSEMFALQEFLRLACEGQTVAIDMLHTPDQFIIDISNWWMIIRENRHRFYTKNMKAFIGYARTMAQKYAVRADRLNTALEVLKVLKESPIAKAENFGNGPVVSIRLSDIWDKLPDLPHTMKYIHEENTAITDKRVYDVCGRKLPINITVEYAASIIQNLVDDYGKRVRAAQTSEGVDTKAISHAFRVGLELKEIITTGDLVFPLKDAEWLKKIKYGEIKFSEGLGAQLEDLIDEVEELAKNSNLPEKADRKWADNFILKCYNL